MQDIHNQGEWAERVEAVNTVPCSLVSDVPSVLPWHPSVPLKCLTLCVPFSP